MIVLARCSLPPLRASVTTLVFLRVTLRVSAALVPACVAWVINEGDLEKCRRRERFSEVSLVRMPWKVHITMHSGIKYVTHTQRHYGKSDAICAILQQTYAEARAMHPQRWSRPPRDSGHSHRLCGSTIPGRRNL